MSDVLKDSSTHALVEAIHANMYEYQSFLGSSPLVELRVEKDLRTFVTGVSHPFMNGVSHTRLTGDDIDQRIAEVLDIFRSRELPMTWRVDGATRPRDLGKRLERHGLTRRGSPGMAADLRKLDYGQPPPSNLVIEEVSDFEALEEFKRVATSGFGLSEATGNRWYDIEKSIGLDRDLPRHHYLGLLNREPVATSSVFLGAGVAGIYNVSTVPEARRRGIGTAMSLRPLREAREMGYEVGILHSSESGLGVYRRIGFREYCKMDGYYYSGE